MSQNFVIWIHAKLLGKIWKPVIKTVILFYNKYTNLKYIHDSELSSPFKRAENEVTEMYEINKCTCTKVMVFFSENGENMFFWNTGIHLQE